MPQPLWSSSSRAAGRPLWAGGRGQTNSGTGRGPSGDSTGTDSATLHSVHLTSALPAAPEPPQVRGDSLHPRPRPPTWSSLDQAHLDREGDSPSRLR